MVVLVLVLTFVAAVVMVMVMMLFLFFTTPLLGSGSLVCHGTLRRGCGSIRGGILVAAHGCACRATDGRANDRTILSAYLVANGCTCAAANCTTHNRSAIHGKCHGRSHQQRQEQISQFHHELPPNKFIDSEI